MMNKIHFYKMEGAGNDFVVLDNRKNELDKDSIIKITPKLCDRRFGIGADGLMALQPSELPNVDYTMLYRNADGSDAGMCGNGSRCLALLAFSLGMGTSFSFNVHNKIYQAEVFPDEGSVSVKFPDAHAPEAVCIDNHDLLKVYTGTEHVVQFVSESEIKDENALTQTGEYLRNHEVLNPPGTNVNFIHQKSDQPVTIKTYERGVEGLTLACGTGAIASAIVAHQASDPETDSENNSVVLHAKGGVLEVNFDFVSESNNYTNIFLKGPARIVFEGKIDLH